MGKYKIGAAVSMAVSMAVFIIIAILVNLGLFTTVDNAFYAGLRSFDSIILKNVMLFFTRLGDWYGLSAVFIGVALFEIIYKRSVKTIKFVLPTLVFSLVLNYLIKINFSRVRPEGINDIMVYGFSFPSAHAMTSATFYLAQLVLMGTCALPNKKRHIKILLITLPLLIGISRIYLGAHYLSDVLAGWSLGIFIVLTLYLLINRKNLASELKTRSNT